MGYYYLNPTRRSDLTATKTPMFSSTWSITFNFFSKSFNYCSTVSILNAHKWWDILPQTWPLERDSFVSFFFFFPNNYITELNRSHKLILYRSIRLWKAFYYFKLTMKLSEIHPCTFLEERNEFWLLGENVYVTQFCLGAKISSSFRLFYKCFYSSPLCWAETLCAAIP